MFNNLSIRSRLIFVIGFLSLLLIGIGSIGLVGMGKANDGLLTVYEDRLVPTGQIASIRRLLLENRLAIAVAQVTPTPDFIKLQADAVDKNIAEITAIWDKYMANSMTAEEKKLAEQFAADRRKFVVEGLMPTVAALRANDVKEAGRIVVEAIRPHYRPVGAGIDALMKLQLDVAKQEYNTAHGRYETIRNVSIAVITLGMLLALVIGFFLIRAIVVPLNEAVAVANAVASGDLTSKIEVHSTNETGRLLQALKLMNENLVNLVGQVRSGTDSISTGSKQIATGNADLSSRTEEQASSLEETASSLEETASSLEELTSTVKQNTENAKQANQLAASASEVAVKGGEVVGQVVTTMSSINDSSKKIADIISVIDGIAFQTNILALNAAVEAARAGEQGRGFAVVATEVRTLAQRSAAAAKEIKELISDSVAKVGDGTRLVDEAGKTMNEIVSVVKRVTDVMAEIAAASQEQSSGIDQINQAVTQMDEVTQQNAALVEEAAAAAESMEEQAQTLTQAVAVFKLAHNETRAAVPAKTDRPVASVTQLPAKKPAAKAVIEKTGAVKVRKVANAKPGDDEWQEF